ncbi:MAG: ABC transporter ATP-binding protein [Nitrospirota bacterium]
MLELNNITKNFGEIRAVDSVSLKVIEGEMLGLVGPNGSGKSTLIKIMLGIARPTSGKVLLDNSEMTDSRWKELRKRIGYMPERVSFYDNLTGRETLELFTRVKGGGRQDVAGTLTRVGLGDAIDRKVGGYSKGMRQRLNFAQALSNDPDLLILDEPTSGLDPVGTKEFYSILESVRARKKLTVILSSHILAEIEEKIDRVAVIKAGVLRAIGTLEDLYSGFNLPIKISISVKDDGGLLKDLLIREGADDVVYRDGHIIASVRIENKLRILSVVMERKDSFIDLSVREPSLEEVFFGIH